MATYKSLITLAVVGSATEVELLASDSRKSSLVFICLVVGVFLLFSVSSAYAGTTTYENLENINITKTSADLSADVSDPDGDSMDVEFIDNSDGSTIGWDNGIVGSGTALVTWSGRSDNTTYSWYAEATDNNGNASTSSVQSFNLSYWGYNLVGSSTTIYNATDNLVGSWFVSDGNYLIKTIRAYVKKVTGGFLFGLYDASTNEKIWGERSYDDGDWGWRESTIVNKGILEGDNIWLVVGEGGLQVKYDSESGKGGYQLVSGLPDNYEPTIVDRKFSIYATVAPLKAPSEPTLLQPDNNAEKENILLRWTEENMAENYRVLIDNDSDFSSPVVDNEIAENSYQFTEDYGIYYWKIVAQGLLGDNTSEVRGFNRVNYPDKPSLIDPSGLTATNTPLYEWTSSVNEDNYRLLVDDNEQFSNPEENRIVTQENYQTQAGDALVWDNTYYWKVIAQNENGSVQSDTMNFFTSEVVSEYGICDYAVITREEYAQPIKEFKNYKEDNQGYAVNLMFWSDIDSNYSGTDYEKIREYIKDVHDNSAEYILLGGGMEDITRKSLVEAVDNTWDLPYLAKDVSGLGTYTPILSYYTGLDGDFDYDNDGVYAEWNGDNDLSQDLIVNAEINENEEVDWSPDVYVGMLPAHSESEMENMVDTVMNFTPYHSIQEMVGWTSQVNAGDEELLKETAKYPIMELLPIGENWWEDNWLPEGSLASDPTDWTDRFTPPSIEPIYVYENQRRDASGLVKGVDIDSVINNYSPPFLFQIGHGTGVSNDLTPDNLNAKPFMSYFHGCGVAESDPTTVIHKLLQGHAMGSIASYDVIGRGPENCGFMDVGANGILTGFFRQFFRFGVQRPGVAFWEAYRDALRRFDNAIVTDLYNRNEMLKLCYFGDPSLSLTKAQWSQDLFYNYDTLPQSYGGGRHSIDYYRNDYGRLENLVHDLDTLYGNNKKIDGFENDLISVENLGLSVENRTIYALRIGNGDNKYLIEGGLDGMEPITTTVSMNLLQWLMTRINFVGNTPTELSNSWNYEERPDTLGTKLYLQDNYENNSEFWTERSISWERFYSMLTESEIWIVPTSNPDSYVADTGVNANNIDINRNWPGYLAEAVPSETEYREGLGWGPYENLGSEPEISALLDLDNTNQFEWIFSVNAGIGENYPNVGVLGYPWSVNYDNHEDENYYENILKQLETYYEGEPTKGRENTWQGGQVPEIIGYTARGSITDWFGWGSKPYANDKDYIFMTEIGEDPTPVDPTYFFYKWMPISLELIAQITNETPSIDSVSSPTQVKKGEYFKENVTISDSDTLGNAEVVKLKIYKSSLSSSSSDNIRNHYSFKWTPSNGFFASGSTSSSYIDESGCVQPSLSGTSGTWEFKIKVANVADESNWNVWIYTEDEFLSDEQEYVDNLTIGYLPDVVNIHSPATLNPSEWFTENIHIRDNNDLSDVVEVKLRLFENSLSWDSPDNERNHYSFGWDYDNGFHSDGMTSAGFIDNVNSSKGNGSLTEDNWVFKVKLGENAKNGNWNVWTKVIDNFDAQDNRQKNNDFWVTNLPTVKNLSEPVINRDNATLEADVTDSGGDDLDWVAFIDNSDGSVIENLNSGPYTEGQTFSTTWTGLNSGNTYSWYVEASDNNGAVGTSGTDSFTTSTDNPPTASFTENSPKLTDENIFFDASGSSDDYSISSYEWDWTTDGTYEGSGQTVEHSYPDDGSYDVTLRVTDDSGQTDTATKSVTINNRSPVADFTYSQNGLTVSFDGSNSYDNDGTISTYEWDPDDDGMWENSGQTTAYTYASPGDYNVTLQVTDNDGAADTVTKTVSVAANDPAVVENLNTSNITTDNATLSADVGDSEGDTIQWVAFEKGDGTIIDNQDVSDAPPQTYTTVYFGLSPSTTYDWKVQAKTSGITTSSTVSFTTESEPPPPDNPPTASFTENSPKLVGQNVYFDASGSTDDGTIESYEWDWDDDGTYEGSGVMAYHSWSDNGVYPVTLRVTDDNGQTGTATKDVTINKLNDPPSASLTVESPVMIFTNSTIDASGSSDPDGSISSYAFDFTNDGTYEITGDSDGIVEHSYSDNGTYTVKVRVTDDDGATDMATAGVTVLLNQYPPEILSVSISENLIDRDRNYSGSDAVTQTSIVAQVRDNDGIESIENVILKVRDNSDSVVLSKELTDVSNPLTVNQFQESSTTGTCYAPKRINDNNIGTTLGFDRTGKYAQVNFPGEALVTEFRYYGNSGHNKDGDYKIQYRDGAGNWVDLNTGISTRGASWSSWMNLSQPVVTDGIRWVLTTLDSTGPLTKPGEVEMRGVSENTCGYAYTFDPPDATGSLGDYDVYIEATDLGENSDNYGWSQDFTVDDGRISIYATPVNTNLGLAYGFRVKFHGGITRYTGDSTSIDNVRIDTNMTNSEWIGPEDPYSENYVITKKPGESITVEVASLDDSALDAYNSASFTVNDNHFYRIFLRYDNFEVIPENLYNESYPDNQENIEDRNIYVNFHYPDYEDEEFRMTDNVENFTVKHDVKHVRIRFWQVSENQYSRVYNPTLPKENINTIVVRQKNFSDLSLYTFELSQEMNQVQLDTWGPPEGIIGIYKHVGGRRFYIHKQYWSATNKASIWLKFGHDYEMYLEGEDTGGQDYGSITADVNYTQYVNPIGFAKIGDYEFKESLTDAVTIRGWEDNYGNIAFGYEDTTGGTNWVYITIVDENWRENVWEDNHTTSPNDFQAVWSEPRENTVYSIYFTVNKDNYSSNLNFWKSVFFAKSGEIAEEVPDIGAGGALNKYFGNINVGGQIVTFAGFATFAFFIVILLTTGPGAAGIGVMMVGVIGIFIKVIGVVPKGDLPWWPIALAIILGFFVYLSSRRGRF